MTETVSADRIDGDTIDITIGGDVHRLDKDTCAAMLPVLWAACPDLADQVKGALDRTCSVCGGYARLGPMDCSGCGGWGWV